MSDSALPTATLAEFVVSGERFLRTPATGAVDDRGLLRDE
jgi:hypothetical protein